MRPYGQPFLCCTITTLAFLACSCQTSTHQKRSSLMVEPGSKWASVATFFTPKEFSHESNQACQGTTWKPPAVVRLAHVYLHGAEKHTGHPNTLTLLSASLTSFSTRNVGSPLVPPVSQLLVCKIELLQLFQPSRHLGPVRAQPLCPCSPHVVIPRKISFYSRLEAEGRGL